MPLHPKTKLRPYDGQENLGYAWELEDHDGLDRMSIEFAFSAKESDDLPDEVDPSKWGLRIENQGRMGSCRGHSLSTGCESLLYWEHGLGPSDVQLSRYYAYRATQIIDGIRGDMGSTISGGVQLAKTKGLCLETLCPYPQSYGKFTVTEAMAADAATRKIVGAIVNIKAAPNPFTAAIEWIGAYGYVDMGIRWPVKLDSNGFVIAIEQGNGGHAMANCGYLRDSRGNRCIVTDNSHSTNFGKAGRMYWTEAMWNRLCKSRYTEVRGLTSLTSPQRKLRAWTPDMRSPV